MDLWRQVQQVFDAALQHSPEKRQEFLEQECGSNLELRREVESLLAAHGESGSFMGEPAIAGMAEELQRTTNRFQAGDTLGAYKVLDLVGRGGMGEVYRARDTRLKRDVAIKVLPREFAADRERLRRFEQEARSAAALNHPNIVSVHDMGTADGSPYIVSELLEGQNLREVLRQGPVLARKALDYAIQAARGLAAAHDIGIVHRDLKPENLFITKDGRLKILDFGLAKLTRLEGGADTSRTESVTGTEVGQVFGTLGYMSPEQVRGQNADHRSDIFSFGAILYELFSGKRAFSGDSTADTMSAILHQDPPELPRATPPVNPAVDHTIRHCLEKNPLERFQSAHDLAFQLEVAAEGSYPRVEGAAGSPSPSGLPQKSPAFEPRALGKHPSSSALGVEGVSRAGGKPWKILVPVAVIVVAAGIGGAAYFRWRQTTTSLTDKDTIVLADFANTTGDPVFDGTTLKQALTTGLEQSPFLNVVSDHKINETLQLMGHSGNERVTEDVAREICVRRGSKAVLAGSIAKLGSQFVLGLKAIDCKTQDSLGIIQGEAESPETVMQVLGQVATAMRSKLGESMASIQQFDKPLEVATTSSLEALQAYSRGLRIQLERSDAESLPYVKHAVELDPNFALAYAQLGTSYVNLGKHDLAVENLKKAYELRGRASESEKYYISTSYYMNVTGEIDKAVQDFEVWLHSYPRNSLAHLNLGAAYIMLGDCEKAAAETRQCQTIDPNDSLAYANLAGSYQCLNRFDESKAMVDEAMRRKMDAPGLHYSLYKLAFLQANEAEMQRQVAWAVGKPGVEAMFLTAQAETEAYYGRLQKAREFSQRAVASALREQDKDSAASTEFNLADIEANFGNPAQARRAAFAALAFSQPLDLGAAFVLAELGEAAQAQKIVDKSNNKSPLDTVLQGYWLPTIRAVIELNHGNAAKAIDLLQPTRRFGMGLGLDPAYIRGLAYLHAEQGAAAATEFQIIIDHPGVIVNSRSGVLAHLGLARAYAMSGETPKAKTAYQDFFAIWKAADPDIPVLKQAKAEYANLK